MSKINKSPFLRLEYSSKRVINLILFQNLHSVIPLSLEFTARLTYDLKTDLTYFMSLVSFYALWKHQKIYGFLMFSEGIERDQWNEMGQASNVENSMSTSTRILARRMFRTLSKKYMFL